MVRCGGSGRSIVGIYDAHVLFICPFIVESVIRGSDCSAPHDLLTTRRHGVLLEH